MSTRDPNWSYPGSRKADRMGPAGARRPQPRCGTRRDPLRAAGLNPGPRGKGEDVITLRLTRLPGHLHAVDGAALLAGPDAP